MNQSRLPSLQTRKSIYEKEKRGRGKRVVRDRSVVWSSVEETMCGRGNGQKGRMIDRGIECAGREQHCSLIWMMD